MQNTALSIALIPLPQVRPRDNGLLDPAALRSYLPTLKLLAADKSPIIEGLTGY